MILSGLTLYAEIPTIMYLIIVLMMTDDAIAAGYARHFCEADKTPFHDASKSHEFCSAAMRQEAIYRTILAQSFDGFQLFYWSGHTSFPRLTPTLLLHYNDIFASRASGWLKRCKILVSGMKCYAFDFTADPPWMMSEWRAYKKTRLLMALGCACWLIIYSEEDKYGLKREYKNISAAAYD